FRAFFALPVDKFGTSTGQSTNVVYGFTSMLIKLLRDEQPTHIAVAWDLSGPTFRHDSYADYKAGRAETPPEFPSQVELTQELLRLLGVRSVSAEGFEADDVIATLAGQGCGAGMEVLIASGDRDAFQLVNGGCTVLYPGKSLSDLTRMTPERIEEKYGVPPERYRDLAALVGEKADNLPGVPGVGPKTAAKWILKYGSLDELVAHADELTGKAGQNFRDHLDDVLRNQRLNLLAPDVPLEVGLADLVPGAADREGVNTLFDDLELASTLRDRLFAGFIAEESGAEAGAGEDEGFSDEVAAAEPGGLGDWLAEHTGLGRTGLALGGWWGQGTRRPAGDVAAGAGGAAAEPGGLGAWLAEHTGRGRTGLACEGEWGRGTGRLSGIVAAAADGAAVHVDPAARGEEDERALAAWLADGDRPKAVHDGKGPLLAAAAHGWDLAGVTSDTAIAAYLVQPGQRKAGLVDLCRSYLNKELVRRQADGGQLSLDLDGEGADAAEAARADLAVAARATAELADRLDVLLEQRGAAVLLRDMELPLVRVLAGMERTGIAADRAYLDELEGEFAVEQRRAVEEAHRVVGREFNLGSPKQLQQVLFE